MDSDDVLRTDDETHATAPPLVRVGAAPRYMSPVPDDVDVSVAELGSEWLGLPLFEQGRNVARLLEARDDEGGALFTEAVVQMPRRSTKTTSIWATLVGRAVSRPGYRCVVTAQSGNVASRILLEHAEMLIANERAVESREAHGGVPEGMAVLYRNGGRERLQFWNGSRIWVVPPSAGAVRSAASDDIVIDEAGEFEGDAGADFLTGVLPLMDTRGPLAQLIIAGTPGKVRTGMFWDKLEHGRSGTAEAEDDQGTLDYSARDDEDLDDEDVWVRVHPGPSSIKADGSPLTPLKVLRKRRKSLGLLDFAREYLCVWPADGTTGALDAERWNADVTPLPDAAARPREAVLAFSTSKEGTVSTVVLVWRDEAGKGVVEILKHDAGWQWVPAFVEDAVRRFRWRVVWDEIGATMTTAQGLKTRRVPGLAPLQMRHVAAAAQKFASEIAGGNVRNPGQTALTRAVEDAAWRPFGRDSRAFMSKPGGASVQPVVAASQALWEFDAKPTAVETGFIAVPRR